MRKRPEHASCTTCCVCCKEIPLDAAFTGRRGTSNISAGWIAMNASARARPRQNLTLLSLAVRSRQIEAYLT
jgi:hypothetical protein